MKTSYLRSCLFLGIFLLFLHYKVLDAVSSEDQKRIQYATSAVQSLAKAMKAVKFISWISTIGSVLGPAMLAVSTILNLILGFLGIESPEMQLMKKEFKNLNNRLDSFSEKFQDVKRKIDWSSVQLSYGSVESNIRSMSVYMRKMSDAKSATDRDTAVKLFVRKYETSSRISSEELYNAIIEHQSLSNSLFEASRRYTNQHPEMTGEFMKGCIQLLIQSFQIQVAYFHLKYNNSQVDEYYSSKVSKQLNDVVAKSKLTYNAMTKRYRDQSIIDLKRMALEHLHLSNQQFADRFYQYLAEKFIDRRWFVVAYDPVVTYNNHGVFYWNGYHLFRYGGRNFLVVSVSAGSINPWPVKKARAVLISFQFRILHNNDPALAIINLLRDARTRFRAPISAFAVLEVSFDQGYKVYGNRLLIGRKMVKWCNDPACWGTGTRKYNVYIFG